MNNIGGLIHLSGTLFQNGQTFKELQQKQHKIRGKHKFSDSNNMKAFGCMDESECWIKFENMEYAKHLFVNDIDQNDKETLNWFLSTLQPEISSNVSHKTLYDPDIVNAKSLRNLYILTSMDNCIDISLQIEMCDAFGIESKDRIVMNTGHNPFVSQPDVLCNHICKWIQRQMNSSKL